MGEILIPRRTKVEKGYELLADITVGTATTSVGITGLNIGKGDEIVLTAELNNTSGSGGVLSLFINEVSVASNYYFHRLLATSTSVTGSISNSADIINFGTGTKNFSNVAIKLSNSGYYVYQSHQTREIGVNSVQFMDNYGTSTFTITSITKLTLFSSVTNAIGIGSRFQLYKIN